VHVHLGFVIHHDCIQPWKKWTPKAKRKVIGLSNFTIHYNVHVYSRNESWFSLSLFCLYIRELISLHSYSFEVFLSFTVN
jgi:hypothetical protein